MSQLEVQTNVLKNGLKVVKIDLPGFHSVTNFLVIRSGSRYETAENNGIAHFLEHMVFKGTKKYPDTLAIAEAIEGIGGHFNAWTANDHTAYWNVVPAKEWEKGLDVVFELAYNAQLRPSDLDRERGVIIEEIRMIQDEPARYVDDLFGEVLFKNHPLGQLIIGSEANIKKMTLEQFRSYRSSHYAPSQALFISVGNLKGKNIDQAVLGRTSHLKSQPVSQPEMFKGSSKSALIVHHKKTDQTHFMIGSAHESLSLNHPQQAIASVLNVVLGRGMSSRLFLNIREKKGLAYAIHSTMASFEDTGVLAVYGGVNTEKVDLALSALEEELTKLQQDLVPITELNKAKALVTGSYDLAEDEPIELAKWYGTGTLLGLDIGFEEAKSAVAKVSAEQVRQLAREVFAKQSLALAVIGPYETDDQFRKFLEKK